MPPTAAEQRALDVLQYARAKTFQLRPYQQHATYAWPLLIEPRTPSMAIDKWGRIYANPDFILHYGRDVCATTLCHETAHMLREHFSRADGLGITDAVLANKSQDAEINSRLADEWKARKDMAPLPAEWCVLPAHLGARDYEPWERYYLDALRTPPRGRIPSPQCGSGATGIQAEWEIGSPADTGVHGIEEADLRTIREQVARDTLQHAQRAGRIPGGWTEWATEVLRPRPKPWRQILDGYIRTVIQLAAGYRHYTYSRPSRRQDERSSIILPAMRSPVPKIAMVGDTSGSMTVRLLGLVRGLVRDICASLGAQLIFFATDAAVHGDAQRVSDGREIVLAGRGGTDMAVGIEHAIQETRPDAVLVATDCVTPWPTFAPRVPVIVAALGNEHDAISRVPPWARVVTVEAA